MCCLMASMHTLNISKQDPPTNPRFICTSCVYVFGLTAEQAKCHILTRSLCVRLSARHSEPVPAYSSLQRESMDREEARLSLHAGGRLIRQLLEEDSDPMLSPRFYAFGQCQQYLDDTEVPPSPPNAHSFVR